MWASDPYPGSMHDVAALDASGLLEGMDPSGWIGRGSAKSVQGGGWVSSLMARRGCGARALVVAAMGVWGPWTRRMRPGGQVSQGGHDLWSVAGAQLVAVLVDVKPRVLWRLC